MITTESLKLLAESLLGAPDSVFTLSKSAFRHAHPRDVPIFNGAVVISGHGVIWNGDINLTDPDTMNALIRIAKSVVETPLYVMNHFGRFSKAETESMMSQSTLTLITEEGTGRVRRIFHEDYYVLNSDGALEQKRESPDAFVSRELQRVASDRESMTEDELEDYEMPFPYEAMALAAKSRKVKTGVDPLDAYIEAIRSFQLLIGEEDIHLRAVVHSDDEEFMERCMKRKVRFTHPFLSDQKIEQEISFVLCNYGPRSFVKSGTPDCIKKGIISFSKKKVF
jgi:hypothetical protein